MNEKQYRGTMEKISVVIIDDHPLFRQGVCDALSLESDIDVISQASNGEDGLELIRQKKPQVAVVDVNLPGINGQQVTRRIFTEKLPTRVVLLTAYGDEHQQLYAIRTGAAAYCTKDIHPEDLVGIIRVVASGDYVIDGKKIDIHSMQRWLLKSNVDFDTSPDGFGEMLTPLSAREMEVLNCVTQGKSNKEIASMLGISHQTVKNHVTSILRKIGVEDRTQAAIYALRRGWVHLHQSSGS
jgi:two-component system response regulator DegU